ncbi:putative transposase for insertion sequence [Acinetobacter baumannii SDF]|uniref:Transposase for insertion sequence n=1 Tax=Acinetobacter baumannii (strain SDF) TaxID=509170 RepID=B0VP76_ACIBS|nr:putative transposase for insertion sequence [Acinetobacter baumannii SDF]
MKISIMIQKKIVELLTQGLTHRQIARRVQVSPTTVGCLVHKVKHTPMPPDELLGLDNQQFETTLQTKQSPKTEGLKPIPDFNYIHDQMTIRDMTLKQLWLEFKEIQPNGVSYSRFVRLYKVWKKSLHSSMRQHFIAGQTLLVDFCGKTMPIHDMYSNKVRYVQIFVAVLGSSSFINSVAVETQTTEDWLKCFQMTFEKLGGVPKEIITDNLKAAVIKVSRHGSQLNRAFEQLADYHNFAILNTRPRTPKDKGLAEVSVQIIQRSVLVKLRHRKFFSLDELQKALDIEMELLNKKVTQRFMESRWDRFLRLEKNRLQSLPQHPYPFIKWIFQQTTSEFYQFKVLDNIYSVPHQYIGKKLDIGITEHEIQFYFENELITSHPRCFGQNELCIIEAHMPENHRLYHHLSPASIKQWATSLGTYVSQFVENILNKPKNLAKNIKSLNKLREYITDNQLENILDQGCQYALQYKISSVTDLIYILQNKKFLVSSDIKKLVPITHGNLRGADYFSAGDIE